MKVTTKHLLSVDLCLVSMKTLVEKLPC